MLTRRQTKSYNDAARWRPPRVHRGGAGLTRRAGGKGHTGRRTESLPALAPVRQHEGFRRGAPRARGAGGVWSRSADHGREPETGLGLGPGAAVEGFASTVREMLVAFIRNHFPTRYEDVGVNDGGGGGVTTGGHERGTGTPRSRPRSTRGELAKNAECVEVGDPPRAAED